MKFDNYVYVVWAYFILTVLYPLNILVRSYEVFTGKRNKMYWGF